MFKGIKVNNLLSYKKVLLILLFVMFFIPKNVFAYTITYNSTFGKFSNNTTTNVVEYDSNHNVISGTYEVPVYDTGIDSSNFIAWYSEYDAKNRVDISEVSEDMTVYAAYEKIVWRFDYTGVEQVFSLPIKAGLQLKVWGAQGGSYTDKVGGYGGYATGLYDFDANRNIYINVGGTATSKVGGYNGGGTGANQYNAQGGGGATHIALDSGLLNEFVDKKDLVAIVAGGGGGIDHYSWGSNGGHGGGFTGGYGQGFDAGAQSWTVSGALYVRGTPGTQTQGGRSAGFGFGGTSTNNHGGGGGGGWYGGGVGTYSSGKVGAGGGGSGYIGNTVESTRHMVGFDVEENDQDSIKTIATTNSSLDPIEDYVKLGNGYAKAELTRINIRYINNFDNTDFTKDQYVGSLAQEFPITQRDGYTAAWYNENDVWNFNDEVNFDTVLEVKYTPTTYNITYNVTGGTVSGNPETYTIESDTITLNNPTPEQGGYIFTGWTGTGLTEKTMTVTIPKGSIGDREYTAHFEKEKYTITYNLNGGELETGVTNPEEYYEDSPNITLNNPSKEGYTFIGWTGSNGTTPGNVVIPTGSKGSKSYVANYSVNQYVAMFDSNLGEIATPQVIISNYNEELGNLPTTSRIGYTFDGWFTERDGGTQISSTTKMPASNPTYYAHWTETIYTIEYIRNYDNAVVTVSGNPTSYKISDSNITLSNPSDPDTYHYFVGWTMDKDDETNLSDSFVINANQAKNIKVYAIFQTSPYTVSFDSQGGNDIDPIHREGTEDVGTLPTPVKDHYSFLGWYVNDKLIDSSFHSRVDVTAIAKWEKIPDPVEPTIINPKTGDNIMKYLVLLLVSIIGLGYTGYKFKLKTKKTQ